MTRIPTTASEVRQSFLEFFRERQHTIVPSASLLPNSPNLLFTNAGMNQFVPYFLGQERAPFQPPRAADTQKCIRAGGKHNDLDDVGFDTYHHTFFEMLGNWSFGDYFKKEAIEWAWKLLVDDWRFPASRLYATVYRPRPEDPATFNAEAHEHWSALFLRAGLDPTVHIVSGGKADNFWMMGETGPCGPCSEIHIDLTKEGDTQGRLVNQGSPLCIEVWNLVFIQFNANPDGTYSPLPMRHVDTGMGFERVAGIIECTDGFKDFSRAISNYESQVFRPIFQAITQLSNIQYHATLPSSRSNLTHQEKVDVAFRVIADHIRTLCFAIADGIIPSNTDRNYVVRRILRRAVLFGRDLGFGSSGFLAKLAPAVIQEFGTVFPELRENQERIVLTLVEEEALFNRTLDRGLRIFEEALRKQSSDAFSPETAFMLYDTYGFPVDLTEVLARERGFKLDLAAVEQLLEVQRERSRTAQEKSVVAAAKESIATEFVGFTTIEAEASAVSAVSEDEHLLIAVDRSPFYAEMGGQVSDTGELVTSNGKTLKVDGVVKQGQTFYLTVPVNADLRIPDHVRLKVDRDRRRSIEVNHTATHLLHWALHQVVGNQVTQKGSYVGPERLRFDFNSNALSPEQLLSIEQLVNRQVTLDDEVSWQEWPYEAIRNRPDVMQFFGEKYGAQVRVVQVGGTPGKLDGYSMELCGGTHVRRTGEIGLFLLASEGAISAGIRRVEALTGLTALQFLRNELDKEAKRAEEFNHQLLELRKSVEKERAQALQREAEQYVSNFDLRSKKLVQTIENVTGDFLQAISNALKTKKFDGVALFFGKQPDQIHVLAYSGPSVINDYPAGRLVQELTAILSGKGGGKPELARGVGKDVTKLPDALTRAREITAQL
ncbi:MAG: alanine--tRNA ligase [Verrucomicrobia bacterium]|nr:alanine--tRNA ligase [Verrucomicrobiota bacterium]